jgi:hypothetical protein
MKLKLFMTVILMVVGAGAGIVGKGYVEKKNAGEEVTLASEVTNCINQGGGVVKGIADNTFHVIKETEFAEGKVVTNPVSGKKWMVISQEKLAQMLKEAWEKGKAGEEVTPPASQPVPVVQPIEEPDTTETPENP